MKAIFSIFAFCAITTITCAQYQFKMAFGNFKELKGQTSINVEFSYEGMMVGDNDLSELQYVERTKSEHNAKTPGRGDEWEKTWYSNKKDIFEPKFHELLRKYSKIANTTDPNAQYTVVVHVKMLLPGFVAWGPARSNAKMDADIMLVETGNKSVCPTRVDARKVPGRTGSGYDFNASERLRECYAKAGKELGKLMATGMQ